MSSEWQVFGWLNRYSVSQISYEIDNDLRRIKSPNVPEPEKTRLLNSLMAMAPTLVNLLEQAELEATCGLLCDARGFRAEAITALGNAQKIYHHVQDQHRKAITEWLLYLVFHGQDEAPSALYWADQARIDLWGLAQYFAKKKDERRERWYRDNLFEITSEIVITPRYIYSFLFEFQGSRLSASAEIIRGKVNDLMLDGKREEAFAKLAVLKQHTQRSLDAAESAEALAFCGLISAEIGRITEAVHFWKASAVQYIPGSHEHTLVQWMLALILFAMPGHDYQGIEKMESCICAMRQLADEADHHNLQIQHTWYEITAEAMRKAMKRMITSLP